MKASEFLELCEKDWRDANRKVQKALGYPLPSYVEELYIDYPSIDGRADADLAREVEDKLFEIADEKGLQVSLKRNPMRYVPKFYPTLFDLLIWDAHANEYYFNGKHDNLSWLMAAALVQLTTEGK